MTNEGIGQNILKYRKEAKMTQAQLADKLGVTYQAVSQWENGTTMPDIMSLPAIAEALSITLNQLFGLDEITKAIEERERQINAVEENIT